MDTPDSDRLSRPSAPVPYASSTAGPVPAPRRRWNPLILVLAASAGLFMLFLVVAGAVMLGSGGGSGSKKSMAASMFGDGSVGVVEMNGVIMDSKKTLARLERFDEDDQVKAVVLRLNSPGGSVAPSQEVYEAVRAYKKPLVVSMGSVAASGAFYIACGAKKVFANPGTITASIGVIMEFANLEKLYEWAKIKRYSLKTGRFKDAGADYRDMQPEERTLLQGMIDNVLLQFKTAVSKGRHLSLEQVSEIADGRIVSGEQAKHLKLVDELGTLQDAIEDAAKQAHLKGKPNVIYPDHSRRKWLEYLLDEGSNSGDDSSETDVPAPRGILGRLAQSVLGTARSVEAASVPGIYWLWSGAQ